MPRLLLLALAAAAAACAAPPAHPPGAPAASARACFDHNFATQWMPYDERTILVREGARAFRVTTHNCPRLKDPLVRITRVLPGGSRICGRQDVRLYLSDYPDSIPTPCFIQSIEAIPEDQARALETARR